MYFAGLKLSHNQGVESLVCLSAAGGLAYQLYKTNLVAKLAASQGGNLKPTPRSTLGNAATAVYGSVFLLPFLGYIVSTALNDFEQPEWMVDHSLPDGSLSVGEKAIARSVASLAFLGLIKLSATSYNYLGSQWSVIGIREKPKIVESGPYRYVRHPLYSCILGMELTFSLMSFSYIPLYAFAISAAALAVKISVEERIIENDIEVGIDYQHYKSHTKYRIIPYIW